MKENNITRAITRCRRLFVLVAVAWLTVAPYSFAKTAAGVCGSDSEIRKLGYWVGDWTMTASDGAPGKVISKVNLSLDNCMVTEHWDGGTGHITEKMFAYSPDDKSWYGMFADNEGRAHVFLSGTVTANSAEFRGPSRGPKGEEVLNRLTIVQQSPKKVQETWEKSTDRGSSWTTVYRADYTRANP